MYTLELPGPPDERGKASTMAVDLLKGVTGHAAPFTMTALMGSSGAGKTTLLDVLAGRKTQGTISGSICVNGKTKDDAVFMQQVSYMYCTYSHHHERYTIVT